MKWWHADVSARVRDLLVAQGRIAAHEQGVRPARVSAAEEADLLHAGAANLTP